jgi:hypothetical protein
MWINQWFVTLHVDHYGLVRQTENLRGFGESIAAGRMVLASQDGFNTVVGTGLNDGVVIGRYHDPRLRRP